MANLKLNHIYKVYPNGVKAVNDFSMEIDDKEFIVFVGPSGCGKSTTLRMIAGLEEISAGELRIADNVVNDVEPKDRDIAMVFQNYALYPHMTVYKNMAFGLKLRKTNKEERDKSYVVKGKNGEPLNRFLLQFGRVPKEQRDENGEIVRNENGEIVYAVKTKKDGTPKIDKNGKPVIVKRFYTDEERMGRVITDNEGKLVLIKKLKKDGTPKTDKNGDVIYEKRRHMRQEIDGKIQAAAKILGITEYLDRKPAAMSGGQRQRVALGRAIVRAPKVFLLDEPLSNLDAKLRASMRSEISKLHQKLQTTFIYVTHDQVEAMTMGTRIVVMKNGFVQQIDTPRNLYSYPCNKFVAGFIGTPQMNFFESKATLSGDNVHIKFDNTGAEFDVPYSYLAKADRDYLDGRKSITVGIRAEHISVDADKYPFKSKCRIYYSEDLGTDCQVYADFNLNGEEMAADSPTKVIIKAPVGREYPDGSVIDVSLDFNNVHLFDVESEKTIMPRVPEKTTVDVTVKNGIMEFLGAKVSLPPAVKLNNGCYIVDIPTAAISIGGDIEATVEKTEKIGSAYLLHIAIGNRVLFVEVNEPKYSVGDKIEIDIDTKMFSVFTSETIDELPVKSEQLIKRDNFYRIFIMSPNKLIEQNLKMRYS